MTQILKNEPDELSQDALIVQTILGNIPRLVRDQGLFAEDLMGRDAWKTFSKGMRIVIGGVIYRLVESKLLPLTYVGKTSSNKNIYRLA